MYASQTHFGFINMGLNLGLRLLESLSNFGMSHAFHSHSNISNFPRGSPKGIGIRSTSKWVK